MFGLIIRSKRTRLWSLVQRTSAKDAPDGRTTFGPWNWSPEPSRTEPSVVRLYSGICWTRNLCEIGVSVCVYVEPNNRRTMSIRRACSIFFLVCIMDVVCRGFRPCGTGQYTWGDQCPPDWNEVLVDRRWFPLRWRRKERCKKWYLSVSVFGVGLDGFNDRTTLLFARFLEQGKGWGRSWIPVLFLRLILTLS